MTSSTTSGSVSNSAVGGESTGILLQPAGFHHFFAGQLFLDLQRFLATRTTNEYRHLRTLPLAWKSLGFGMALPTHRSKRTRLSTRKPRQKHTVNYWLWVDCAGHVVAIDRRINGIIYGELWERSAIPGMLHSQEDEWPFVLTACQLHIARYFFPAAASIFCMGLFHHVDWHDDVMCTALCQLRVEVRPLTQRFHGPAHMERQARAPPCAEENDVLRGWSPRRLRRVRSTPRERLFQRQRSTNAVEPTDSHARYQNNKQ